ncbi:MAG TPA: glycosyltransferase 87 family protein [Anaerolineales bacterium]|nr:glycosyltransferase 87 family protein [Anaerolineales bacterium]
MKRRLLIFLIIISMAAAMLLIALYVPNSLPVHSDFSAIYNTTLALIHRVPIYDLEQVEALAVQFAGIPEEDFFLARFPYPPWYALSTFYLGLMPAKAAGTLWFELNLVMLFLSVWLLTEGWSGRLRLIAFPLALFFFPVLGALSVGQYDFPVLLGTSFLIYSIRKENVALTVLGMVLLTFKPHLGALILLAALGWLIDNGGSYGRRVMRPLVIAGVALFVVGFIADPTWVISYPKMLLGYQNEGNVSACSECASLAVWISRWFFDGSLTTAAGIAIILFIVFISAFIFTRSLWKLHDLLLNVALLVTLLISPYLYNYDFLLLLVPFATLIHKSNLVEKIGVLFCYLLPTFALILYGRSGNISLIVVTIVLLILLFVRAKNSVIDFTAQAAYNTNN